MKLPLSPPVEPMLAKLTERRAGGRRLAVRTQVGRLPHAGVSRRRRVYLQSRDSKPMGRYFPELEAPLRAALPARAVFDGEIVIAGARRPRLLVAPAAHPPGRVARRDAGARDPGVVRRLGSAGGGRRKSAVAAARRAPAPAGGGARRRAAARPPDARDARSRAGARMVRAFRGRGPGRRHRQASRPARTSRASARWSR